MKVVNPLFRNETDSETAAYGCNCVCNVQLDNKKDGDAGAFWFWNPSCGCGCDPNISGNSSANSTTASNRS